MKRDIIRYILTVVSFLLLIIAGLETWMNFEEYLDKPFRWIYWNNHSIRYKFNISMVLALIAMFIKPSKINFKK